VDLGWAIVVVGVVGNDPGDPGVGTFGERDGPCGRPPAALRPGNDTTELDCKMTTRSGVLHLTTR
jgi:hypothetical protein